MNPEGRLILVLGGIKSGKSRFAERLANDLGGSVLYLATADRTDAEMSARIEAHRSRRPSTWRTLEASRELAAEVANLPERPDTVIVEDLGQLVSNLLLGWNGDEADQMSVAESPEVLLEREIAALVAARRADRSTWIVVSNEVGLGMVPLTALGRRFADLLGCANQEIARQASAVYLVVAGHVIDVSALGGVVK